MTILAKALRTVLSFPVCGQIRFSDVLLIPSFSGALRPVRVYEIHLNAVFLMLYL